MIETKTIFTKKKKPPRHARPDEKKKKSKTREEEKKKPSNIRKNTSVHSSPSSPVSARPHSSALIRASIRTSALIHTHVSIRLSVQIFRRAFDISPGGSPDGRRLCTSAFRRFFFRSSADPRPRTGSGGTASSSVERSKTKGKEDFRVDRTLREDRG